VACALEAQEGDQRSYWVGSLHSCRSDEQVFRHWVERQDHQVLGSGGWLAEDHADWPHQCSARSRSFSQPSLPLLLRRGQDGKVLGFGIEQGSQTIPWALKWSLCSGSPPGIRPVDHRRQRLNRESLGHEDQSSGSCFGWALKYCRGHHLPSR
jgi:hypothetical protein